MRVIEYMRMAFHHLRTNLFRAFLTMLGIVIGIGSIIAVVSVGEGGRVRINKELESFGVNRLGIYSTLKGSIGQNPLTLKDAEILKKNLQGINALSPLAYKTDDISCQNKTESVDVIGAESDIMEIDGVTILKGRFLTQSDIEYGRKVVVLNEKTAEKLFGNQDPLSKKVMIQNRGFQIVGIQKASTPPLVDEIVKNKAYIPITSFYSAFSTKWINEIAITVFKREEAEPIALQAVEILERRHDLKDNYKSYNFAKEMELARKIMYTFTMVIGAIAAISLIVGGIGVMNIMLVTVTERTQEIGIRKALGATDRQILGQFLMESLSISTIGGIFGTGIGILFTILISKLIQIPMVISLLTISLAVLFSLGIGLFFGMYPAKKAADLDPIEALRYD